MKLPTIDQALGIEVTLDSDGVSWTADATRLPGTPPVGRGKSIHEAKYDLLAKLHWDRVYNRPDYSLIVWQLLKESWDATVK